MMQEAHMQRCLELARYGQRRVGNGAMVGAVLVRGDQVVAEAFHEGFGEDHAERKLLRGFRGSVEPGDVLYSNLEPCCHVGKTSPCTEIILARGVKHVVFGMVDPDGRVAGKGARMLQGHGVEVIGPVLPELCARVNRGFIAVRTKGRPWVTLKMARMLDGRVAKADGSPLEITSQEQDQWSHAFLRARHDAILVGVETVVRDDPQLTLRCPQYTRSIMSLDTPRPCVIPSVPSEVEGCIEGCGRGTRDDTLRVGPWRIVLDPHLRIPLCAQVVSDGGRERTMIIKGTKGTNGTEGANGTEGVLRKRGVRVVEVSLDSKGRFVWRELWKALIEPSGDFHGITSILVEGGQRTWEVFREVGMIDEEVILLGGG